MNVCIAGPWFLLLGSFLFPRDVTAEWTVSSIRPTEQLPDWLHYVRVPGYPTDEQKDSAKHTTRTLLTALREIDMAEYLTEYQYKIGNATEKEDSVYLADPIVDYFWQWKETDNGKDIGFTVDGITRFESQFNTTEEKVMAFTVIRIMADYLFKSKDILVQVQEEGNGHFIELKLDIPDEDLVGGYFLMDYVNAQAEYNNKYDHRNI